MDDVTVHMPGPFLQAPENENTCIKESKYDMA